MFASGRTFTKEFKDDLGQETNNEAKPVLEVAKSSGVGPGTLRRWRIKYRENHAVTHAVASSAEATRLKSLGGGKPGAARRGPIPEKAGRDYPEGAAVEGKYEVIDSP